MCDVNVSLTWRFCRDDDVRRLRHTADVRDAVDGVNSDAILNCWVEIRQTNTVNRNRFHALNLLHSREAIIVPHQIIRWFVHDVTFGTAKSLWVGCYIWYKEEGPGRAGAPPSPLFGRGDWAGPQPAQALPPCTRCNSPPINGQCTNHRIAVMVRCSAVLMCP